MNINNEIEIKKYDASHLIGKKVAHKGLTKGNVFLENSYMGIDTALKTPGVGGAEFDFNLPKDAARLDSPMFLGNYKMAKDAEGNMYSQLERITGGKLKGVFTDNDSNEISNALFQYSPNTVNAISNALSQYGEYGAEMAEYLKEYMKIKSPFATFGQAVELHEGSGKELYPEAKTSFDTLEENDRVRSKEETEEVKCIVEKVLYTLEGKETKDIHFIGRNILFGELLHKQAEHLKFWPVIGYSNLGNNYYDTIKLVKALEGGYLEGGSLADNHLAEIVPGTNMRAFEWLADQNIPVTVWGVDTLQRYINTCELLKDVPQELKSVTTNYPDLFNQYDEVVRSRCK